MKQKKPEKGIRDQVSLGNWIKETNLKKIKDQFLGETGSMKQNRK